MYLKLSLQSLQYAFKDIGDIFSVIGVELMCKNNAFQHYRDKIP